MDRVDDEDETPEQRALRALRAIDGGADIGAEAFALSNEFTDRHSARLSAWFRRRRRASRAD